MGQHSKTMYHIACLDLLDRGVVTFIVFGKKSTVDIEYLAGWAVKPSWPFGERKSL